MNGAWRKRLPAPAVSNAIMGLHLDMHRRHVAIARHNVIIEIRLLYRTIFDADPLVERQSDAVDDATLGLRHHVIRLHGHAAVDGAPDVVDEVHYTREVLLAELEEARKMAIKKDQPSAAVSATIGKARVLGLIIDRREVGDVGAFDGLTDEELIREATRRARELGLGCSPVK